MSQLLKLDFTKFTLNLRSEPPTSGLQARRLIEHATEVATEFFFKQRQGRLGLALVAVRICTLVVLPIPDPTQDG